MNDFDIESLKEIILRVYNKKIDARWNTKKEDVWDASEDYGSRRIAEITSSPRMTLWDAVKSFFSDDDPGAIYTRSSLISYLERNGFTHFTNSMDTYRNYLSKAEYLTTIRRGFYKLVKEIPVDLSIGEVKSEAYGDFKENRIHELDQNNLGPWTGKAYRFIDVVKPTIKKPKVKNAKIKKRDYGFIKADEFQV